jgi:uncharacterized protein YunC (DUF1805 family)
MPPYGAHVGTISKLPALREISVMPQPQPQLSPGIVLADTITKLGPEVHGCVLVSGSHGGRYCGYLALKAHARAVILNDAGVGRDNAGIASLDHTEPYGLAAATVSHMSCRIGSAADMMARGIISHANASARAVGVVPGMSGREAAERLCASPLVVVAPTPVSEGRRILDAPGWTRRIVLADSASMVTAQDKDQIVLTASHGALLGGDPRQALLADGFAGVFNDAGVGIEGWGITRLPALDGRGIAGLTVSAQSARIGDAQSTLDDGQISHVNAIAAARGARPGMALKPVLNSWALHGHHSGEL